MGNVQNIAIKPVNATWGGTDLGYLDGDVAIKITESLEDITTHQTGKQVIGNVRTGLTAEVTLTMKESDVVKLKQMIEAGGASFTPTGTGPTPLVGFGTSKVGSGTFADAKRLVLHGVNASDTLEDWTFWRAYPVMSELKFSGQAFQLIPITFKCYVDTTKDSKISLGAIGDSTQTAFDDVP